MKDISHNRDIRDIKHIRHLHVPECELSVPVCTCVPVSAESAIVAPGVRGRRELEGIDQDENQH